MRNRIVKYEGIVYHHTTRKDAQKIMVEGLRPLAKNRPKELQIVDAAFDRLAKKLGMEHRRRGIFAWPGTKDVMADSIRIGIINPENALVLHQAWVDLAWGIIETTFRRMKEGFEKRGIPEEYERLTQLGAEEIYDHIKIGYVYEGRIEDVIERLGRLYWKTGIPLEEYEDGGADKLTAEVTKMRHEFSGLLPWLDHEVVLGVTPVPPENLMMIEQLYLC